MRPSAALRRFGDAPYGFPRAEVVTGRLDRAPLAKAPEDGLHQADRDTAADVPLDSGVQEAGAERGEGAVQQA
ncbi:hypothetical protein M2283_009588 [Streptomyces pseudovenezuelae]|uniref:Uncharacterized protein n=1 Tax=Streptomyces pseudovenezuelae TaxID=67350 RepID=A0ABT6M3M8_9ACTN|nr:hypothetical protein [Streptomyces pseudovenezuelae]